MWLWISKQTILNMPETAEHSSAEKLHLSNWQFGQLSIDIVSNREPQTTRLLRSILCITSGFLELKKPSWFTFCCFTVFVWSLLFPKLATLPHQLFYSHRSLSYKQYIQALLSRLMRTIYLLLKQKAVGLSFRLEFGFLPSFCPTEYHSVLCFKWICLRVIKFEQGP